MQTSNKQPGIKLVKKVTPITENTPMLTKDGNFEVKESIVLNVIIAVVICPICFYEMYKAIVDFRYSGNYILFIPFSIYLLGVIFIFRKLFNRRPIILVNQKGIYIRNELGTNWANFVDAKYT